MLLEDVERSIYEVKDLSVHAMNIAVQSDMKGVEELRATKSSIDCMCKTIINKLLQRYSLYKSDISYSNSCGVSEFKMVIYINGNTLTITYEEGTFTSFSDTITIKEFLFNSSLIDRFIYNIDYDIYTLLYINA